MTMPLQGRRIIISLSILKESSPILSLSGQGIANVSLNVYSVMIKSYFSDSRVHVLSVVAIDCGGKESSPVLVTINITPACRNIWSGQFKNMTDNKLARKVLYI